MRVFWSVIVIVFGIFIGSSCSKTTKQKVSQKWKVIQYNSTGKNTESGDIYIDTRVEDEKSYSTTSVSPYGSSSTEGLINEHTRIINKDGTWSTIKSISYNEKSSTGAYYLNKDVTEIIEKSGFWHFLSKNKNDADGFIKNEKITFYALQEKRTVIEHYHFDYIGLQPDSVSNITMVNEFKYENHNNFITYIVDESKKDLLKLKIVGSGSYTDDYSQNDNYTYDVEMTLKKQ